MAAGCSKPEGTDPPPPAHLEISAAPTASQFDNTGGQVDITIESNYPWTASMPQDIDWVELSPQEISAGNGSAVENTEVTIVVARNELTTDRTATITFTSKDQTREFTLTQAASFLVPSVERLTFTYPGSTQTMTVASNVSWEAEIDPEVSWCTMERDGDSLTFTADPNDGSQKRTATLLITTDLGISAEIPMTQFSTTPTGR